MNKDYKIAIIGLGYVGLPLAVEFGKKMPTIGLDLATEKVEAFSTEKLEELLTSLMKKEFRFIEWVGAFLGFLIGCIQVALTLAGS